MNAFLARILTLVVLLFPLQLWAAEALKLALNWKPEPQFGGFYQAQIDGEYKKAGLEVQILEGGSGTPTIQMLTFGKVDAAIVSAEEILISNERNPKNQVVALFAVYQTNPQILMTRKDRGLISIAEILNQPGTVAAQSGLTYVSYLKNKYPSSKVTWVPYTGGISGLLHEKNYTQQGFLTSEPFLAEKQGVEVSSFLIADEGFNPYTTVVAVRAEQYESQNKNYVSLISAIRKGWESYLKNPDTANKHMAQLNKSMDLETFKKSASSQIKLIKTSKSLQLGQMSTDRWQSLIQTLKQLKVLKTNPKPEDVYKNL